MTCRVISAVECRCDNDMSDIMFYCHQPAGRTVACTKSLYLADDCCLVSDIIRRSLQSADVPTGVLSRTLSSYSDRTSAAAGPRLWHSLPVQLRNPDITYGLAELSLMLKMFWRKNTTERPRQVSRHSV